jgi:hypothetical protein
MMERLTSNKQARFRKGTLVNISRGNYLRLGKCDEVDNGPFRKFDNDTSAILVEFLGKHPNTDIGCWSVYAKNDLLILWEDQVI